MNKHQEKEFQELADQYAKALDRMNKFITSNDLDFDDCWNKANQYYDKHYVYASDKHNPASK